MSRFDVDKFIAWVESSDDAVRAYVEDPAAYVAGWTRRAEESRLPRPDAGPLDGAERTALIERDHATLYRLGTHPYVLWHFVEATRVWTGEVEWPVMKEQYRRDVEQHGAPDYAT